MHRYGGLSRRICDFMATSRVFVGHLLAIVVVGFFSSPAFAQGLTPDQLQQLQQQQNRGGSTQTQQPAVTSRETVLEPTSPGGPLPISEVERIFSARSGKQLTQYGYDQLGIGRSVTLPQVGAVQDDYVMGPGDEVVLTLRGQENNEYHAQVDRDGNVSFPRLNPVSAAGRSFGQFRQDLISSIQRAYVSTQGFVTIGRMRQISVLVSGEVGSPGVRTLTGLSTVVDAVLVSGGIKKSGSLRSVKIVRGDRQISVDLYSILMGRVQSKNVALANGDRIIVPPLGGTVAVAGNVRRPGIYELPVGQGAIGVRSAVSMASGTELPGSYSISVLRTQMDGKRQFVDVTGSSEATARDGDLIMVRTAVNVSTNQVTLEGAVRTPGTFASGRYKTLHDLLPSLDVFQPGAYLLIGVIDRTNPKTLQRSAIPFSPLHVVQGKENLDLMTDDTVRILTKASMRTLVNAMIAQNARRDQIDQFKSPSENQAAAANANQRSAVPGQGVATDAGAVTAAGGAQSLPAGNQGSQTAGAAQNTGGVLAPNVLAATNAGQAGGPAAGSFAATTANMATPNLTTTGAAVDTNTEAGALRAADQAFYGKALYDYRMTLSGAVQDPGVYLVASGTSLADALGAAGGLTNDADLGSFELTSTLINNDTGVSKTLRSHYPATQEQLAQIILRPYDDANFRHVYSDILGATVTLRGEVRYPGTYSILRGERLSSVLERAGGLTETAYPYGTVFQRQSVSVKERENYQRQAMEIENQLITAMSRRDPNSKMSPDAFAAIQSYVNEIRNQKAVGRVTVAADPAVLAVTPGADPLLEANDSVYIPPRPFSVAVMGEVLQPGNIPFRPNMTVGEYVDVAGGYTRFADEGLTILVYPDGSARRIEKSWFKFSSEVVPPGSAIFVARDMSGIDTHQIVLDFTTIISQFATTAASLAVLSTQIK